MTAEELLEHADVICQYAEALRDGKNVNLQFRYRNTSASEGNDNWHDFVSPCPSFNTDCEWRLKPEPRHFWFLENAGGGYSQMYSTIHWCEIEVMRRPGSAIVEVVEVLK